MKTRAALAALAMGATMSLAGCSLAADVTTARIYDPSDGVGDSLGSVSTDNFLMIASAAGEPGAIIGHIYNENNEPAKIALTIGDETINVVVPAQSGITLGLEDTDRAVIADAPVAPGLITTVTVQTGTDSVTKSLPVLDGTLPEYAAILEQLAERDN